MDYDDNGRIWTEMKRFALYDDYKDLYNRCMPAIKGIETRM